MPLHQIFHVSCCERRLSVAFMLLTWYIYDVYHILKGFLLVFTSDASIIKIYYHSFTGQYLFMHIFAVAKDFLQLRPIFLKTRKVFRINSTGFKKKRQNDQERLSFLVVLPFVLSVDIPNVTNQGKKLNRISQCFRGIANYQKSVPN